MVDTVAQVVAATTTSRQLKRTCDYNAPTDWRRKGRQAGHGGETADIRAD